MPDKPFSQLVMVPNRTPLLDSVFGSKNSLLDANNNDVIDPWAIAEILLGEGRRTFFQPTSSWNPPITCESDCLIACIHRGNQ
mmetsp:Transcript_38725/g.90923  ORF Transcript_38725/g.90923 Transcript_38725/m.90923 type:complete len:83 (-) Transcript_38725:207-455(-)